MTDEAPHSQLYFTDTRDHWWNEDFLALLAQRLGLHTARRVLDIGAGQGHFARAMAPHLHPDATITCLDREPRSLAVAESRCAPFAAQRGLRTRFEFVVGDVTALPFANDGFDLVMGQTILLHVRDPRVVFDEMKRVTRPGGRLLSAEPNNFAGVQRLASLGPDADPEEHARDLRFQAYCLRGKARLGLGWNNFGTHLPQLYGEFADARYFSNDRPWVMAPPYASDPERAAIADLRDHIARGIWGWERDEARRYYVAGGGDASTFEREYDAALVRQRDELTSIEAGTWSEVVAVALFVASGTRP